MTPPPCAGPAPGGAHLASADSGAAGVRMSSPSSRTPAAAEAAPLDPEARHRVLVLWNLTEAPFPRHRGLGDVLHEALVTHASRPALVDAYGGDSGGVDPGGGDDGVITRGALARRGLQVAAALRALGAGPRRLVAVAVHDPAGAVEALLGALWAGAAVAPLDPAWPPEALARALAVLDPSAVVTDAEARARLPRALPTSLWLDGLPPPDDDAPLEPLAGRPAPVDPALVLPTAPGAATALVSSHRAVVNALHARLAAHGAPERLLVLARPGAPAWAGALPWALAGGGAVVLLRGDDLDAPAAVRARLAAAGATHVVGPARRYADLLAGARPGDLAALRGVVVEGAAPGLARRHGAVAPAARLWRAFTPPGGPGPVAGLALDDGADADLAVGRPLQNVRCYVLDPRGEPAPPGVEGDLWVGGEAAPAASLGRSPLDVVPDRFRRDDPDATVAPAGVRARWRADGVLELTGAVATPAPAPLRRAPLAPTQEAAWVEEQLAPDTTPAASPAASPAGMTGSLLRGDLDRGALEAALAALVRRHDALRVRLVFDLDACAPAQEVLTAAAERLPLEAHDVTSESDPAQAAAALVRAGACAPLPLERAPLARVLVVRTGPREHVLALVVHRAVADDASLQVLLDDLAALYAAARAGVDLDRALPPPRAWLDAARALRLRLAAREVDLVARWRARLEGAPPPVGLPGDRPAADRPAAGPPPAGRVTRDLDATLAARVRALGRAQGAAPAAVVLAALEVVLHRWTGERDLVLGVTVSLRDRADHRTVGALTGAALVRGAVAPGARVVDVLRGAHAALVEAQADGLAPLPSLLAALGRPTPGPRVLFEAPPARPPVEGWGGDLAAAPLEVDASRAVEAPRAVEATVRVRDDGAGLRLEVDHDAWRLTRPRVAEVVAQVEAVLRQAVDDPERLVDDLDLVTPEARALLPDPTAPLTAPADGGLHAAFEAQARAHPRRLAVVDPRRAWSYEHLRRRAVDLARDLRAVGVVAGDRVAVWAPAGAPLAAAVLAALRVGAEVVTLDPARSTGHRVAAARALVVLDEAPPPPASVVAASNAPVVPLVAEALPRPDVIDDPGAAPCPDGGLLALVLAWQRTRLRPDDRVAVLSGAGDDALLRDLLGPLVAGASARVPDALVHREPARLLAWLREERVTVARVSPGLLEVVGGPTPVLPDLRLALASGGRLVRAHAAALARLAPTARLVSLFEAAGAPPGVAVFEVDHVDDPAAACPSADVPAGRGVAGTQLLVLRPGGRPAGVGELGEVHVRAPGGLLPTGDLGRYRPDGAVELAARRGRQVALRGARVDLGAVEAALAEVPGVEAAVAALREGPAGPRLVAWARVALLDHADGAAAETATGAVDGAALQRAAAAALPAPARPEAVVVVRGPWPLTGDGEVDLARLPAPQPAPTARRVEPRTQLEARLVPLCARLLGRERIGVHDDVLPRDGLPAARLLAALGEALGARVPAAALQGAPTIARLARAFHARGLEEPLVVDLLPGGPRPGDLGPPLWIVHDGTGHLQAGRRLAAALDADRPVVGLQAPGLDGLRPPLDTVEALVERYLPLVRDRQSRGPYHLVGPGLGGQVAWELARRLAAAGEEVALLALLDAFAPGYPRVLPPHRRALDRALALLSGHDAGAPALDDDDGALPAVAAACAAAAARHAPGAYRGPALLVRAARRAWRPGLCFDDPDNGWRPLARGGLDTRVVDATGEALLEAPAIDAVAAVIDQMLDRAQDQARRTA